MGGQTSRNTDCASCCLGSLLWRPSPAFTDLSSQMRHLVVRQGSAFFFPKLWGLCWRNQLIMNFSFVTQFHKYLESTFLELTHLEMHWRCLNNKTKSQDFPGGPRLRLWAPTARGLGLIPGQGTRSHILKLRVHLPQLKILHAATKTQQSQKKKKSPLSVGAWCH